MDGDLGDHGIHRIAMAGWLHLSTKLILVNIVTSTACPRHSFVASASASAGTLGSDAFHRDRNITWCPESNHETLFGRSSPRTDQVRVCYPEARSVRGSLP